MRLWPKHWHAETWICSLQGHSTPARFSKFVTSADAALGAELTDGRRLARCLRCDSWVEHLQPVGNEVRYDEIPSLDKIEKPRRDEPLQEAILMRLIAINKGSHALFFTIAAIGLLLVRTNLFKLQSFADRILKFVNTSLNDSGQGNSRSWVSRQLEHLLNLKGETIGLLIGVAALYAVVEWAEAIGLWKEKRWAEYLTVIATAGFLPIEIKELLHKVTVLRVGALVVNLALLIWLVWNKRLFGVRGGEKALHEHDSVDWPAVLAAPKPALGRVASLDID
jgi:uncharacterized membrane protein (DUF2068 family)